MKLRAHVHSKLFAIMIVIVGFTVIPAASANGLAPCFDAAQVTAEERARFYELLAELRCMKCANQSLLDSPADVADDMRQTICQQVRETDMSDADIKDYFASVYDERVLFTPRGWFWVIWPFLGLLLIAVILFAMRKRNGGIGDSGSNNQVELEHANTTLANDPNQNIPSLLNMPNSNDKAASSNSTQKGAR